jgi:dihydroorotate dehydrogenase electron transfer subunit
MDDYPHSVRILELKNEATGYYTVFLPHTLTEVTPGQFVMLWIPRIDEKPFGVSSIEPDRIGITFEVKGRFTQHLSTLKKGDVVGIRGPYGTGFPPLTSRTVIVAGGCGIAPLAPLVDKARHCIIGARNSSVLLFRERFPRAKFCTDDGSYGEKGFVTRLLQELFAQDDSIETVYCCGPEIMMKKVMELCQTHHKECYVSVERYMKCGFGICGQCLCGDIVTCKDGPVVPAARLMGNEDFMTSARLKSGKKVLLTEYYSVRTV